MQQATAARRWRSGGNMRSLGRLPNAVPPPGIRREQGVILRRSCRPPNAPKGTAKAVELRIRRRERPTGALPLGRRAGFPPVGIGDGVRVLSTLEPARHARSKMTTELITAALAVLIVVQASEGIQHRVEAAGLLPLNRAASPELARNAIDGVQDAGLRGLHLGVGDVSRRPKERKQLARSVSGLPTPRDGPILKVFPSAVRGRPRRLRGGLS